MARITLSYNVTNVSKDEALREFGKFVQSLTNISVNGEAPQVTQKRDSSGRFTSDWKISIPAVYHG